MKNKLLRVCLLIGISQGAMAQNKDEAKAISMVKQEIIELSEKKWRWMSEKKVEPLEKLFHEEAMFVHMGGNMTKSQELSTIKSGRIHYKQATIEKTSVRFIGNTSILLSKIRLQAVVGGREVTNPFTVTEVFVKIDGNWKLASLSFSKLLR
ncbi:MAG: nuclear transport factor 2 family protein [Akkermansiaceae bacterium]|nr:nuclear transport factor 2 family protein [Akkermansiaceae bacterium]